MCPNHPVEQVSWDDVHVFIDKLNRTVRDGNKYRLPTEAEWEFAARANTKTAYFFGNEEAKLGDFAWFDGNSGKRTHDVAEHAGKRNGFKLADMHGNVWQWVEDFYGEYPTGAVTDPKGPTANSKHVIRGGSWGGGASLLRAAFRGSFGPGDRDVDVGFRLVRSSR